MSLRERLRGAFWLLPALLCVTAVVVAETLLWLDRRGSLDDLGALDGLVNRVGEAGSRDLLGAIATSTLSAAATSFSITIAVLATASSTYGPRLVRNFMADRGNQLVLGVFTATFLYSLLVLRSIRSAEDGRPASVPHLAVGIAVLLGVGSIGVLVWFIHHIADSVQVWTLARSAQDDLLDVVDRRCPRDADRAHDADLPDLARDDDVDGTADAATVPAGRIGYVQAVSDAPLVRLAARRDLVVRLLVRPGDHVVEGTPLARVGPRARVDDDVARALRDGVVLGATRTPHQDVGYAVQVLEEMAVRALSRSTNDPYTALNALDGLEAGLTRMAGRSRPSPWRRDDDGRPRVEVPEVGLRELVDRVAEAVRTYALDHPAVLRRAVRLLAEVGRERPEEAERVRRHVRLLLEAYARTSPLEHDLAGLREVADAADAELAGAQVG